MSGTNDSAAYVIDEHALRVRDMPLRLRPREALERQGVRHVPDDVLVAVILRSGVRGANVMELARQLMHDAGSLSGLALASVEELSLRHGMGKVKAQVLCAALELGRRLSEEAVPERMRIRSPGDVADVLRPDSRGQQKEVFWVLVVDTKNVLKGRPLAVTTGLLDASLVHPREVFREAIRRAAAAVVLAHNHPSGDVTPSAEDIRVTRQLVGAGEVLGIDVLDHVIVGEGGTDGSAPYLSMREQGLVDFKSGAAGG